MGKLFSIALSLMLLVQSLHLDMVKIAQLDDFLTHAQFHKQKYGDNLFDFVSKHYGSQKEQHNMDHPEEHKDHNDLPFNNPSCIHTAIVFVLNEESPILPKTPHALDTLTGFFYQQSYEQLRCSEIFQPPKNT